MQDASDRQLWSRVKDVLNAVSDVPPSERAAAVEAFCRDDLTLLQEVLGFLELDDKAETFIREPLWRVLPEQADDDIHATRLGPYRLERLLGKGGMGEVYLAVREDDYEQKVAIKRTLGPVMRDELQERFMNERQILATLQHPGIARLLDGGADDQGLPYLVMEYVDGSQIDTYCLEHELTLRQRLRLISKVCRIVHHAHQSLVVHRDLKPSNILVTPEGQPRLLDFGIAKLLNADAAATAREMAILTPSCASPEQIMGERVTTACDIYALGVLLYRLLAGKAPYNLSGLPFPAVRRIVCLQDIRKPSQVALEAEKPGNRDPDSVVLDTRELFAEAQDHGTSLSGRRRLSRQLRGDLDAIVMKALRKEPEHRFLSAAELADDIDRYLGGLPVEARKGNWFYHAGKHLRRNKPIVALMAMILVLAVTATALGLRAESARRVAVEARDSSTALQEFLVGILQSAAPDKAKGRDRTVREVVEEARPKIDSELAGRPRLQAEMSSILAQVFNQLGDSQRALELYEEALEATIEYGEEPCSVTADRIANIGSAHYNLRRYDRAEKDFKAALDLRDRCADDPLATALTLTNLTNARMHQGQGQGIAEAYERALDLNQRHGASLDRIGGSHHNLGTWYLRTRRASQAIHHLEQAHRLRRQTRGELSTSVASIAKSLARAYHDDGRLDEARVLYERSLADYTKLYDPAHLRVIQLKPHVVRLLLDIGDLEAAGELATGALAQARALEPEDPRTVAIAASVWGAYLARRGDPADADRSRQLMIEGYEVLSARSKEHTFAARWTLKALEGTD